MNSSLRPGQTRLGGRGVPPRRWLGLKEGPGGQQVLTAWPHQPWGTGSRAQAVVGAQGGLAGGNSSLQPGHTGLGGRGILPRRWSVL